MAERISETAFQKRVIDTAKLYNWMVCHHRPARTRDGWRTAIQGDAGLPDLILARHGRVLLVELKSNTGTTSPDQVRWLAALGEHGRLWRPSQWDAILRELSTRPDWWVDEDTRAERIAEAADRGPQ